MRFETSNIFDEHDEVLPDAVKNKKVPVKFRGKVVGEGTVEGHNLTVEIWDDAVRQIINSEIFKEFSVLDNSITAVTKTNYKEQ